MYPLTGISCCGASHVIIIDTLSNAITSLNTTKCIGGSNFRFVDVFVVSDICKVGTDLHQ